MSINELLLLLLLMSPCLLSILLFLFLLWNFQVLENAPKTCFAKLSSGRWREGKIQLLFYGCKIVTTIITTSTTRLFTTLRLKDQIPSLFLLHRIEPSFQSSLHLLSVWDSNSSEASHFLLASTSCCCWCCLTLDRPDVHKSQHGVFWNHEAKLRCSLFQTTKLLLDLCK